MLSVRCICQSSRHGYILLETLVAVLIFSLAAFALVPSYRNWQKEKELEMAAEEVAAAIRQVEVQAKSDIDAGLLPASGLYFICETKADGNVKYHTRYGVENINPKGSLPDGICLEAGNVTMRFRKDTFAGTGETYNVALKTKDGKYRRIVTVAMYTGRVRIK